jgi:hypothetical protein
MRRWRWLLGKVARMAPTIEIVTGERGVGRRRAYAYAYVRPAYPGGWRSQRILRG